jgi:hypothetical protein
MGTPARFAVAQRSTAECLGMFAAAQKLFERRGVDFHLVAFETAAERGLEGLIASEWDYIEIGVIPLVRLRADGYDPAIVRPRLRERVVSDLTISVVGFGSTVILRQYRRIPSSVCCAE